MGMNLGLNALVNVLTGGRWASKSKSRRPQRDNDSPATLEALESRELLTTFTVTTPLDDTNSDSSTSLREAIAAANANPGPDIIRFASGLSGQNVLLTQGELTISDSVTITGLGANKTVIDGQLGSRVFSLTESAGDVTLDGMTIKGGRTEAEALNGAGIFSLSFGTLTVKNSSVNSNATFGNMSQGAGIYSAAGEVVVINSSVWGNSTSGWYAPGGGIATHTGSITLVNSTISNNVTGGPNSSGGGIATFSGNVTLTNTTVTQNATLGTFASGGGIFSGALAYQQTSTITINNSIVAQNVSNHSLYMDVSKNTGVTTLAVNSSLIGVGDGTGLATAPLGSPDSNGNLIGTFTTKIDPKLGPLATNGGATKTHALLSNSPAIDMGDNSLAVNTSFSALTGDQSGQIRVFHSIVDMGASELQSVALTPTVSFSTATLLVGEGAGVITLTVNLSNSTSQPVTIPITVSGTATNHSDYDFAVSTLVIPAGATSGSIQLTVLSDDEVESNESIAITLGTPTNATLGSVSTETLTIVDSHTGAPTELTLSAQTVSENIANLLVGTLAAVDPNSNNSFTYSIQPGGAGSSFRIVGNQLKVGATGLDFEALPGGIATVTVRVSNSIGSFLDKQFNITVRDLNEAPSIASGQAFTAPTGAGVGTVVGNVIASDPDLAASFKKLTYSIVGGNTNRAFIIDAVTGQITVASASAFKTSGQKYTLQIKVTDGGSPKLGVTVPVTIRAVTPFVVKLSGNAGKISTAPNAAFPLDSTASLINVDPAFNLAATRITVSEIAGASSTDTIFVRSSGAVTVSGRNISVNGVVVAHTSGGISGLPLSILFTAGSKTAVNAVLGQIAIQTTSTAQNPLLRTIKFTVNAGSFSTSTQMTARVVRT